MTFCYHGDDITGAILGVYGVHLELWLQAIILCIHKTLVQIMIILYFISDKMKDAIIAKLANQAADYYGDAFKQCQYKDTLPKVSNPKGGGEEK